MASSPKLIPDNGPQIRVAKAPLLRELTLLQSVIERKNTIPILSTILIQGRGGEITIIATDLDVSLQTVCAAEVTGDFACVVQARKFFDIVRSLADAEINMSIGENNWVTITCGASEFHLQGQSRENFPATPTIAAFDFGIAAATLHGLITRTAFAITTEESRYALSGSLFRLVEGQPMMVATDGHRLALATANASVAIDPQAAARVGQLSVVIPKKGLNELAKLTAGESADVQVSKDDNHLYFKVGARLLTSRMLAGQFPNYEMVIPKANDKVVTLKRETLAQAVKRAGLMADERSHGVKLELSKDRMELSAQATEVGQSREVVVIEYAGDSLAVGFNYLYVLDFLNNVADTERVTISFKDEQNPVLFTPDGDTSFSSKSVVMPMRLI